MIKTNIVTKWHGDRVKIAAKNTAFKSVLQCAVFIQSQAVLLCPVKSGHLRASIQIKYNSDRGLIESDSPASGGTEPIPDISNPSQKNYALVGTAVVYAAANEFGINDETRTHPSQPYLRPAFDLAAGKVLNIVTKNGKDEFREYLK